MNSRIRVSIIGVGNAGFRLAVSLKSSGVEVISVINRRIDSAKLLASILNKPENNPYKLADTIYSNSYDSAKGSDIILLSVSDKAIDEVTQNVLSISSVRDGFTTVCHISGAVSIDSLSNLPSYGVFYPLMTLSKNKPIDISITPFLIEYSDNFSGQKIKELCNTIGSEFSVVKSSDRLKMQIAAVYVSSFANYLSALAYEIASPNHVLLLPLAIETIRKAFLYGDPALVQTGPESRGDFDTIKKHLDALMDMPEHIQIYQLISKSITDKLKQLNQRNVKF